MPAMSIRGLVLFAHGARDPRWAEPFHAIADRVRQAGGGLHVELAYLELMQPTLATAVQRLLAAGVKHIDVVPLFLGTGGHLRKDLPPLVEHVRSIHADEPLEIRLHPAIGEDPGVIDAMVSAALSLASSAAQPGERE